MCHRLDHRQAVGLEARRQAIHRRARVELRYPGPVVDEAEDLHARLSRRVVGAHHLEPSVGPARAHRPEGLEQDVPTLASPVAAHEQDHRLALVARGLGQRLERRAASNHGHLLLGHPVERDQRPRRRGAQGERVEGAAIQAALPLVDALQRPPLHVDPVRPVAATQLDGVVRVDDIGSAAGLEQPEHLDREVERLTHLPDSPGAVARAEAQRQAPSPVEARPPARALGMERDRREQGALERREVDATAVHHADGAARGRQTGTWWSRPRRWSARAGRPGPGRAGASMGSTRSARQEAPRLRRSPPRP